MQKMEIIILFQITAIYCICDEIFQTLNITHEIQSKISNAEVVTFAPISALHYGGNYHKTLVIAKFHRYFTNTLRLSRMTRRIHRIQEYAWRFIFQTLQAVLKNPDNQCFIIDSFPVKSYENHKSFRAKIFSNKR